MTKKKIFFLILSGALLVVLGMAIERFALRSSVSNNTLRKLQATLELIDSHYVDSISVDSIVDRLIPAVFDQLDPHSRFLTAEQQSQEAEQMEGHFYGIGITYNTIKDTAIVISTIPHGPSDLVGVKPGDRIIKIDGREITRDMAKGDSLRPLLRGPKESLVTLTLYRPETHAVQEVKVTRDEVPIRALDAVYMLNDSLGCISFSRFNMNTYNEFIKAYGDLSARGMKAMVIDLRSNPGGLVQAALLISNAFLPKDRLIFYTQGYRSPREETRSDGTGALPTLPIYILIDENSASSSEILSGALQDNDRAIIIGRRSFGKGLVQRIFEYKDGSALHLTISRYYTPSGRSIQRPYKMGEALDYSYDWVDRVESGELFHKDSIHFSKKDLYHTIGGRSVYGGGGITPDVFIPRDTAGFTTYLNEVASKGLLAKFAFLYADRYRSTLLAQGDVMACHKYLQSQGLVWQFGYYAQSQGIRMRSYLIYKSQAIIERSLYGQILNLLYGPDEGQRVGSLDDPMLQKAAELFASQITSPLQLEETAQEL